VNCGIVAYDGELSGYIVFLICCEGDADDEKLDENPSEYGDDPPPIDNGVAGDAEADAGAMDSEFCRSH